MSFLLARVVKTTKDNSIDIQSNNYIAKNHFDDPRNYADFILNQINTEKLYLPYLTDHSVIFDIGANIGLFSLHCLDCAKVIYAFEPTPQHFNLLTEFTRGHSKIQPINVAISDKDADIDFFMSDDNTTMNSIVNHYGKKVTVKGRSILSFIQEHNIEKVDFVKCDIEGSEMVALTFETVAPLYNFVDKWFIEVHATSSHNTHDNRNILKNIFETVGYNCQLHNSDTLYVYK
jgi:FkbM family methyltransferase